MIKLVGLQDRSSLKVLLLIRTVAGLQPLFLEETLKINVRYIVINIFLILQLVTVVKLLQVIK